MLVPDRWPEVPPEWQGLDARLTEELAGLRLYDEGFFSDRQLEAALLAAQDMSLGESATAMHLSPATVSAHRSHAFEKIGVSGVPALPRLVYTCLDSRLINFEPAPESIELSAAGAVALKGVFLGYDGVVISRQMPGRTRLDVRADIQEIADQLEAKTEPGIVRRAYEVGLCIPRPFLPSTDDPAIGYYY